jgi:hypothetical protein
LIEDKDVEKLENLGKIVSYVVPAEKLAAKLVD